MCQMAADDVERRIHWVQVATIAWMIAEAAASLFAAWLAHSPALLAFGGDSAIELLSAAMVLWSIRAVAADRHWERNVDRAVGGLLFALAAYILVISCVTLAGHREPKPTLLGIAVLIAAAVIMKSCPPQRPANAPAPADRPQRHAQHQPNRKTL